ncbi:MAG TPA: hypothetical protein VH540_00165 [Ktedonobacterales bacterium]
MILGKQRQALTPLQAARLMTVVPTQRSPWHEGYLTCPGLADPDIAQTYALAQAFAEMLRTRQGTQLEDWLAQVQEKGIPELLSFANGIRKDYEAVKAGLTLEWS